MRADRVEEGVTYTAQPRNGREATGGGGAIASREDPIIYIRLE